MDTQLTEQQQKLADRIAQLLAASPLEDWIKTELLNNLDRMPEHQLVQLVGFLTDQESEMSSIEEELKALARRHAAEWKALEKKQESTAMNIVNAAVAAADAEGATAENLNEALSGSSETKTP